MARDSSNGGVKIFRLNVEHKKFLGLIRHWTGLMIAIDGSNIWLKGITTNQEKKDIFQSIPFLESFTISGDKLFPKGHQLPSQSMPTQLSWSPIHKALPVQFPKQNHNFFGVSEQFKINIIASKTRREAIAMMTTMAHLKNYVLSAPKIRLESLKWIILNKKILIMGTPILPIPGQTLWQQGRHLLPTGYDFEYPILAPKISKIIQSSDDQIILWTPETTYSLIEAKQLRALTIRSFRLTIKKLDSHAI